jgi:hypothetical protein
MISIFSIPKAFDGHIGIIQRNALGSWAKLGKDIEIILIGNEPGIADAAATVGATHIPVVERTIHGTPLVSSAFSAAARAARNSLLCYVNADIMFTGELLDAVAKTRISAFLMTGRRWNVDILEPWNFLDPQWDEELRRLTKRNGKLYRDDALDYFIFPRASRLIKLPPFAVGRPRWDNYLLFRCRQLRYPLIDATEAITAVHQNHDYAHVPKRSDAMWDGPEAAENIRLLGSEERVFGIYDATHKLGQEGIVRAQGTRYDERYRQTYYTLHPNRKVVANVLRNTKGKIAKVPLARRAWYYLTGKKMGAPS